MNHKYIGSLTGTGFTVKLEDGRLVMMDLNKFNNKDRVSDLINRKLIDFVLEYECWEGVDHFQIPQNAIAKLFDDIVKLSTHVWGPEK